MNITIFPSQTSGVITAPLSRIETQQALVLAAITRRSVRSVSSGLDELLSGLKLLGAGYRREGDTVSFFASPKGGEADVHCDIGTLPLLLSCCVALGGRYTLHSDRQTIAQYQESAAPLLQQIGFEHEMGEDHITMKGVLSAQTITTDDAALACAMVLALPLNHGIRIASTGHAKSQMEYTAQIMGRFGFVLNHAYIINEENIPKNGFVYIPGVDYGIAVYLLLCGIVSNGAGVTGLISDSNDVQKNYIERLISLGLPVTEMNGAVFTKSARIKETDFDAREYRGMLPIIAVLAAFSRGKCSINHVDSLQTKEQDELMQTVEGLTQMGADIMKIGGDLLISGKKTLTGGRVDVSGNASVAMALCVAALGCELPTAVNNAPDIREFACALRALGVLVQ